MFENFRDKCIKIYGLDPVHFLSAPRLSWQGCLKKTGVKLKLLNDNDMLTMFEKGIRGGMWNAVYRNAKANNKYMQNYDENIESPFLQYLDANNQYWWTMSEKFPVYGFKWIEKDDLLKFDENFIKNCDNNSDIEYVLEVDVEYPKSLHKLHSDLPFLLERMKTNKCNKLLCSLQDKEDYVVHIKALKQAWNHGLILKKVDWVIEFRKEACLKPYIDMNTKLRTEAKNEFQKKISKQMTNRET